MAPLRLATLLLAVALSAMVWPRSGWWVLSALAGALLAGAGAILQRLTANPMTAPEPSHSAIIGRALG